MEHGANFSSGQETSDVPPVNVVTRRLGQRRKGPGLLLQKHDATTSRSTHVEHDMFVPGFFRIVDGFVESPVDAVKVEGGLTHVASAL